MFQNNLQSEEDILKLISDRYSRTIIDSIQTESKTVIQMSNELGIELSAIYRRLHKFQKHNLLKMTFQITSDGKKSHYYQNKINSVHSSYEKGNFKVNISLNSELF